MRAETGPMKFGDDWTGLFIRGDNAMVYKMLLDIVCGKLNKVNLGAIEWAQLQGLIDLLSSAGEHRKNNEKQIMKEFDECKK